MIITVNACSSQTIDGVSRHDCEELRDFDPIRQAEIVSIRRFLEVRRELFGGRILDFGAGKAGTCRKPQPYRYLLEGPDAEYHPYDRGDVVPNPPFDVIVCTQVLQYLEDPALQIAQFGEWLRPRLGTLVMTYPTNWAECEPGDLWRFTKAGVERMLERAGFAVGPHERRAEVRVGAYTFPLGYGVVAIAR
jgi:SAM-dependent methyltransferase